MTREEAGRFWPIIKAYAEGKQIETKNLYDDEWRLVKNPCFTNRVNSYRVKKEPVYRPFKDAKECWEEMMKHQPFGWLTNDSGAYFMMNFIDNIQISIPYTMSMVFDEALNMGQKFADGTPFGVKEED